MANPFVHIELQTKDLAKAKDFYTSLFDWKLEDLPAPDGSVPYTMINVGEGTGGGMFVESHQSGVFASWSSTRFMSR
jgi:predicted enzyme related to lactoylglutathione lyase